MDIKIGFIGVGNIGTPMVKGIIGADKIKPENIYIYDVNKNKAEDLCKETGVNLMNSNKELVENSDIIILAVKPNYVRNVISEIKDYFDKSKILIPTVVGVNIKVYKEILGEDAKVVRIMPNTPIQVGEGMTVVCFDNKISNQEKDIVKKIFEYLGKVEELEERLMSEVTALTGSSPAYVYIFIEAMADAAVLSGLPRELSYRLAAQAVLGSAKMALESGKHPGELKDQVCSPAGTTIEAVNSLEKNSFRYVIMNAMTECTKKAREIGQMIQNEK